MNAIITSKKEIQKHLILIELIKLKASSPTGFVYVDDKLKSEIAAKIGSTKTFVDNIARRHSKGVFKDIVTQLEKLQVQLNADSDTKTEERT